MSTPDTPKKASPLKAGCLGCLGLIGVLVVAGIIASATSGGSGKTTTPAAPAATHTAPGKTATTPAKAHQPATRTVVFKVWGSAPGGADITYGSDSDNLQGGGLPMTKTLKVKSDALYYQITAQLQGNGDIHCSVTIGGTTKTGHAQGGYNICSAQLNGGLFGDWN